MKGFNGSLGLAIMGYFSQIQCAWDCCWELVKGSFMIGVQKGVSLTEKRLQRTTLDFFLYYIIIIVVDCCMPIDK
jgi:hypothetical protein